MSEENIIDDPKQASITIVDERLDAGLGCIRVSLETAMELLAEQLREAGFDVCVEEVDVVVEGERDSDLYEMAQRIKAFVPKLVYPPS